MCIRDRFDDGLGRLSAQHVVLRDEGRALAGGGESLGGLLAHAGQGGERREDGSIFFEKEVRHCRAVHVHGAQVDAAQVHLDEYLEDGHFIVLALALGALEAVDLLDHRAQHVLSLIHICSCAGRCR